MSATLRKKRAARQKRFFQEGRRRIKKRLDNTPGPERPVPMMTASKVCPRVRRVDDAQRGCNSGPKRRGEAPNALVTCCSTKHSCSVSFVSQREPGAADALAWTRIGTVVVGPFVAVPPPAFRPTTNA